MKEVIWSTFQTSKNQISINNDRKLAFLGFFDGFSAVTISKAVRDGYDYPQMKGLISFDIPV